MSKAVKITVISLVAAVVLGISAIIYVICFAGADEILNVNDSPALLAPTPDYGQHYINSTVFLGDFTVYGMYGEGVFEDTSISPQVWSGADGRLSLDYNTYKATVKIPSTDEEMTLEDALMTYSPQYVTVTLGRENALEYCDKEAFVSYYTKLVQTIKESSPQTGIILQSILPVTGKYQRKNPQCTNKKIDICNTWICEIAESENVKFLNTSSVLKDSSGNLMQEYASSDGSHLNRDGYLKMFEYMRTHGYTE